MGAIAGRLQFGHRIRFAETLSIGLGAWIWLLLKRFCRNPFELMTIRSQMVIARREYKRFFF
jgi:hypothetical protein